MAKARSFQEQLEENLKAGAEVEIQTPPAEDPLADLRPPKVLTETEQLKLRLYLAEGRAAAAEARVKIMEKDQLLKRIDPKGLLAALDLEIKTLLEAQMQAMAEYMAITEDYK